MKSSKVLFSSSIDRKKGITFLSPITKQEPEEIMYLTNALGNEEDRTSRARNTIFHQCSAVVSDAVPLQGR